MSILNTGTQQGPDLEGASAARICNLLLGGGHHWAPDRELGAQITKILPAAATAVKANRAFVTRAVRYSMTQGVRQFLVITCGSPLDNTIHDLADAADPTSRCMYVDADPISIAHTEVMLDVRGDPDRHTVICADLRSSGYIWDNINCDGILDPEQPMALILTSILPFMPRGEGVETAIAQYKQLLPAGSYFIASHTMADGIGTKQKRGLAELAKLCVFINPPICYRSRSEFTAFFAGLEIVEPGIVWVPQWRQSDAHPETDPWVKGSAAVSCIVAGVGRKP